MNLISLHTLSHIPSRRGRRVLYNPRIKRTQGCSAFSRTALLSLLLGAKL